VPYLVIVGLLLLLQFLLDALHGLEIGHFALLGWVSDRRLSTVTRVQITCPSLLLFIGHILQVSRLRGRLRRQRRNLEHGVRRTHAHLLRLDLHPKRLYRRVDHSHFFISLLLDAYATLPGPFHVRRFTVSLTV